MYKQRGYKHPTSSEPICITGRLVHKSLIFLKTVNGPKLPVRSVYDQQGEISVYSVPAGWSPLSREQDSYLKLPVSL